MAEQTPSRRFHVFADGATSTAAYDAITHFYCTARLTSWHTLMAHFVQSRNGEESVIKIMSPDPEPDHLRELSHRDNNKIII